MTDASGTRARRMTLGLCSLITLLGTLMLPDLRAAQGTVSGRVLDQGGEPVAGASVTLLSREEKELAQAQTGPAGAFSFEGPALDQIASIRIDCDGFLSVTVPAPKSMERELSFTLLQNRIVDRVAVTATRQEKRLFDTPQSVSVVTSADMDAAGAATIPEALENEPGLSMQRTTLGAGSPVIRGLIGNQVLILVDGIRLNNSTFRLGPNQYLNTIDRFGTKSIEVVRGPASSLYGSDGLGGVVNILTEDPLESWQGDASSGYDSAADAPFGSLRVGGTASRLALVGGMSAANFGDLEGGNDTGEQSPTGYQRRAGDLKVSLDMGDRGVVSAAGQYLQDEDVPRYDRVAAGKDQYHFFDPQRRTLAYLRYTNALRFMGNPSFTTTFSRMDQTEGRRILAVNSVNESRERDEVTTYGVGAQIIWPEWKRNEFVAGVELYDDDVESSRVRKNLTTGAETSQPGRFPDGAEYLSAGAYTQTTIRAGERLDLTLGGRYSRFEVDALVQAIDFNYQTTFDDLTGSANFLFRMTQHLHLGGGISEGFRAPALEDSTVFGVSNAGVDVPNTDLKPEHLLSYELSFKALYPRLWASVSLYDSRLRDLIDRAPGTFMGSPTFQGEPVFQRKNIAEAKITGAELDVKGWPTERVAVSLTLANTRGTRDDTGEPLSRIPPLAGRFGVRSLLARSSWVELALDFAAEQDRLSPADLADIRIPAGGTPGYGVVSLGFGIGEIAGWQGSLWLQNIGDADYRVHVSGINGPGRSVRLFVRRAFEWSGR